MTYGNSRGKNPGSRKPRPGAKRNGVGASSSTVNLVAKLQAAQSLNPVHQGLHAPRVATARVLPSGIGGHRIAPIVPAKLSRMSAANTG